MDEKKKNETMEKYAQIALHKKIKVYETNVRELTNTDFEIASPRKTPEGMSNL